MNMNDTEKKWILKCKTHPDKYRIMIDNDSIFIDDMEKEEFVFEFNSYGYEFAKELLDYIGCNTEHV